MAESLKSRAMRIPATNWFRAVGPRVFPPLHRFMARVSSGKWHPGAAIILTTTGAKSGQQRTTPLEVINRGDGSCLVVASNFAGERHPAWSWNLLALPDATVVHRGRRQDVRAVLLEGEDREAAWQEALTHWPTWSEYTKLTDRQFRIFHLMPTTKDQTKDQR